MIFTVIRQAEETHDEGYVFGSYRQFFQNTFSPDIEVKFATDFSVKGKTYKEKKEYARNLAIELQHAISDAIMSWGEHGFVTSKMECIGQRYGLREEFRVNGII